MNSNDTKIVLMGMSCAGKTTFAKTLLNHTYYCFDALFPWHDIETLGLSISSCLKGIQEICREPFVLDGWHLADPTGIYMPKESWVYVIYSSYKQIISQYRVDVDYFMIHWPMFKKWYGIDYTKMPRVRFIENTGHEFILQDLSHYQQFLIAQCL